MKHFDKKKLLTNEDRLEYNFNIKKNEWNF